MTKNRQQKQAKNNIIHLQIAIKLLYHHCTVIIPITRRRVVVVGMGEGGVLEYGLGSIWYTLFKTREQGSLLYASWDGIMLSVSTTKLVWWQLYNGKEEEGTEEKEASV